jgi:hypothetical protein
VRTDVHQAYTLWASYTLRMQARSMGSARAPIRAGQMCVQCSDGAQVVGIHAAGYDFYLQRSYSDVRHSEVPAHIRGTRAVTIVSCRE